MKGRVFVGLSGGVDSAVAAALLKQEGYDVTGVFIKIWQPEFIECTWREDRLDAMRVAAHLSIPFQEVDLSDAYRETVIRDMVETYRAGRTPNPDVLCNEKIKFGDFYDYALAHKAEYVATGHYARIAHGRLMRGIDPAKDQSYFIYRIRGEQLERVFFPVGRFLKRDIRHLAREFALPVHDKKDSQGLCFIGDVSMREFLSRYIEIAKGDVLDVNGSKIGEHDGAGLFTIGQRHGFSVHTPSAMPLYVIATDAKNNTITVSPDKNVAAVPSVVLRDLHWIREPRESVLVQTRYHETPVRARLVLDELRFDHPHIACSGQSAVLYDGDECVGGGTIA